MPEWFPYADVQSIIKDTGGTLVTYKGEEAYFHSEQATHEDIVRLGFSNAQGIAHILVGDARAFPDLEEDSLIVVDGKEHLVGDWATPGDGADIHIALKTGTRV